VPPRTPAMHFLALRTRPCCERWRSQAQLAGGHHLLHERPERGLACPARVTQGEFPRTHKQRIFSHKAGILVYPSRNLSTKVLTGQSVRPEREFLHSRAAPQLRRDCTCAARRSFLGCCKLVYPSRNLSTKVLTSQPILLQPEVLHSRAAPQLRRNVACAARRSFLVFGLLVYHARQDEQNMRTGQFVKTEIAVGIRPATYLIERFVSRTSCLRNSSHVMQKKNSLDSPHG
jgi:hypothetical protein